VNLLYLIFRKLALHFRLVNNLYLNNCSFVSLVVCLVSVLSDSISLTQYQYHASVFSEIPLLHVVFYVLWKQKVPFEKYHAVSEMLFPVAECIKTGLNVSHCHIFHIGLPYKI
jgi:hypothetical protein